MRLHHLPASALESAGDASQPSVFVAHHNPETRDSLEWSIGAAGLKVRAFDTAEALVSWLDARGGRVRGVVVSHLWSPGLDGVGLQEALRARGLSLPVILVTSHDDVSRAVSAMKAGAFDLFQQPVNHQALLARVREALAREASDFERAQAVATAVARWARLSPRERQVMRMVVEGRLNKQIAGELGLSSKTVEVHRAHVMQKMEAESLAELVREALMVDGAALGAGAGSRNGGIAAAGR